MTQVSILLAIALLAVFIVLLMVFNRRVRAGRRPNLRRIPAFDALKGFSSRAIESGRPLHLSVGVGGLHNETTADTLAGLTVLNHLAKQAAATGINPTVTMADPMVTIFAQNSLRAAHGSDALGAQMAHRSVRWIAPQPAAYAAGVMSLYGVDKVQANIMIGNFGDEYLLMGEPAAAKNISHIGGASDPNTLPFIYTTAQETLLGEEIYAAGAYLQKSSMHISSLLAQDTIRWILVAIMLGGIVLTSLGWMNQP